MRGIYAHITILLVVCNLTLNAQTGGETCATSVTLSIPATGISGSTAGAIDDYNEDCEGYGIDPDGRDVVYNFAVPSTGYYDFTLCQAGTDYDTKFYIYESTCPASGTGMTGLAIDCDDDNCDGFAAQPWSSYMLNVFLSAGTTYYLVIDGYSPSTFGTYVLSAGPAVSPPSSATLVLDDARSYDYSRIPQFNLISSIFTAAISNLSSATAGGVVVDFTAFGPNDFSGALIDHLDASTSVIMGPFASTVVSGNSSWLPSDTGNYLLQYVVSSTFAGVPNDTMFQFLQVNVDQQARDYSLFGDSLIGVKLLYSSADTEYGVVSEVHANANLKGVSVLVMADPPFIGDPVVGSVYSVGVDTDDLTLVSTGVSPDPISSAQLIYDVPLSGSLVPDKYVATYTGNNFIIRTDALYSNGFSDLVRDPSTTGGLWGFLPGPYAWAIDLTIEEGVCNSTLAPIGLSSNVTATQLMLEWDKVPFSLGCQINAGPNPGPFSLIRNTLGFEVSGVAVPLSVIPSGNYKARVRCACAVSPLDATAYSGLTFFTIPSPRIADEPAFSIYPNPAADRLVLTFSTKVPKSAPLQIVTVLGEVKLVDFLDFKRGATTLSIDVSTLSSGLYFLEIGDEVVEFTILRS